MYGGRSAPLPALRLTGGIVAHNEEFRVSSAIESLVSQSLPDNVEWDRIWVVASGCTDRTVAEARSAPGPVEVVEQAQRLGKSAALLEVFRRARGDLLVLLNGDAVADPGSIRLLVEAARGMDGAFAIMARPVPAGTDSSWTAAGVRLLWDLHHRFYVEATAHGGTPSNLSDELLVLPVARLPPLEPNVVNDGGFIGAWLARMGRLKYEPRATVSVATPRTFPDYLRQRRRIRAGARQLRRRWGVESENLSHSLARRPGPALQIVRSASRSDRQGVAALSWLCAAESASAGLALLDARRAPSDLAQWFRIADPLSARPHTPPPADGTGPTGPRTGSAP